MRNNEGLGTGRLLARCLLAAFLLGSLPSAQANLAESVTKSATKRALQRAGAAQAGKQVGKQIYRRLPAHVEKTFARGQYSQRVLKQDLIAYRYHSPMNPHHDGFVYTTTERHASEKALRDRLAIPPVDNVKGRHITQVDVYRVPHNTRISEGAVAPVPGYKGGGHQIVLENPPDAWIIETKSFNTWRRELTQ